MTIMQRDFLDSLAKLFKAYNVACVRGTIENVEIIFKDPEEEPLKFFRYSDEIFHQVQTKQNYKPTETELDA